jgi:hypothetical protein
MANHREYYHALVAGNQNDYLIDLLLETIAWHKTQYEDAVVSKKYEELLLLSSRNRGVGQAFGQGILTPSDAVVEENKINLALIALVNDLPEAFFIQIAGFEPQFARPAPAVQTPTRPKSLAIPSGLGKGLYWMTASFFGMVSAGSLIQDNRIAFVLTALAVLLCAPSSYEWLSARTRINLSNSLRVLLIIALMSIGLSYAKPVKAPAKEVPVSTPKGK